MMISIQRTGDILLFLIIGVECGIPPSVNNAVIAVGGTSFEDELRYTCVEGFQTSDNTIVTCMSNTSWSALPTCTSETPLPVNV